MCAPDGCARRSLHNTVDAAPRRSARSRSLLLRPGQSCSRYPGQQVTLRLQRASRKPPGMSGSGDCKSKAHSVREPRRASSPSRRLILGGTRELVDLLNLAVTILGGLTGSAGIGWMIRRMHAKIRDPRADFRQLCDENARYASHASARQIECPPAEQNFSIQRNNSDGIT